MHHAHDRGRVAEAVEHLAPRLSGLPRIVICSHAELGVFSLDRRVDHIAGYERIVSGLADQHGVMVDRMAGRRNELNRLVERKIALYDLRASGLDDWEYRVSNPRDTRRIILGRARDPP